MIELKEDSIIFSIDSKDVMIYLFYGLEITVSVMSVE